MDTLFVTRRLWWVVHTWSEGRVFDRGYIYRRSVPTLGPSLLLGGYYAPASLQEKNTEDGVRTAGPLRPSPSQRSSRPLST